MILKEIYLYPDLVEYGNETVHPFRDQSRSICNYLERQLKKIKFTTEGFNKICFIGKSNPNSECYINSSNVLIVETLFDEDHYLSLDKDQINDFFSGMLMKGINKCALFYDIPENEFMGWIEEFSKNGYVNTWIFKSKLMKIAGIKCVLHCELKIESFHLKIIIEKGNKIVFEDEIMSTDPDEIVFSPMFKDVKIIDDCIVVLDKYGDSIYSKNINELRAN